MDSTDKPLHVAVAEALGWTEVIPFSVYGVADGSWCGDKPGSENDHDFVPRYDTDWSAGGPLIEKYRVETEWCEGEWLAWSFIDCSLTPEDPGVRGEGQTPLIAVCHLILELKKAGKLDA